MEKRNLNVKTKGDIAIKGSFKDDFKYLDVQSKGFIPIRLNSFNGPTLFLMMTSQIGCEVELTAVF